MKTKLSILIFFLLAINISAQKINQKCIITEETINVAGCSIKGTLLVPKKSKTKTKLLILVAGSGATDRNGNFGGSKNNSLKTIAEELCINKIACFRFDKRMIGESKDTSISEIDLRFDTYINDLEEIIKHFKNTNKFAQIIVAGHSEGSLIGMVASKNMEVDKYISIAGVAESIDVTLKEQLKTQPKKNRAIMYSYIDSLKKGVLIDSVPKIYNSLFRKSVQPYMISWMKFEPTTEISKLQIPVLILQGTNDIQVKPENAELLHKACKQSELKIIDGMSHILKPAPANYTENYKTYFESDLKLHKELMPSIIEFINKK